MSRLPVALLTALAAACSPAGGAGPEVRPPLTLSPAPELEEPTRDAAAAWTEATGIEIFVGSGGIPVWVDDELESCGMTFVRRLSTGRLLDVWGVAIRTAPPPEGAYCRPPSGTARHELAHVIRALATPDAPPEGPEHASSGLFAERANRTHAIDGPALELVCAAADCTEFEPEGAQ